MAGFKDGEQNEAGPDAAELVSLRRRVAELEVELRECKTAPKRLSSSEELRTQHAYLLHIVMNLPALIVGLGPDGETRFVNPAVERVTGYHAVELIGRNWYSVLYPGNEHRQVEKMMGEVQRRGGVSDYELVLTTKDGHRKTIAWNTMDLTDGDGNVIEAIGCGYDLTDRKLAEDEHRRLREEFIRMQEEMLRELSTPLIPISETVVVMPLIGTVDARRAEQIMSAMLTGVSSMRAQAVILDVTGVRSVDTLVANAILRAANAVRLLGARVVLTGIRPEVAQTLVTIGADLGSIITRGTLQAGIAAALR